MCTCHASLRYFDWDGQVHLAEGKTVGQQGGPLEILIFNLTIHNLWGRVLAKFQEARAVAYADDGCIKGKLSVAFRVLAELKRPLIFSVLKVSLVLVCLLVLMLLCRTL
jgi:hypothetical protein